MPDLRELYILDFTGLNAPVDITVRTPAFNSLEAETAARRFLYSGFIYRCTGIARLGPYVTKEL